MAPWEKYASQENSNQAAPWEKYGGLASESMNNSLGSQAGLWARSSLRGLAGLPQLVTEPIRQLVTDPLSRALYKPKITDLVTGQGAPQGMPLTSLADRFSDVIGLPKPDTATQRTVDKAVELGTGAGGLAKLSKAGADALSRLPQALQRGGTQRGLERLAADPAMQVVSGAGAGGAGQQSAESGDGALGQFGSAVLGGLAAPASLAGVRTAGKSLSGLIPKNQQLVQQRIDQRINIALESNGIDLATITPAMRTQLREQVGRAMELGDNLNESAVARLADYTRLGMTPTKGRITLDPYDVTQEANASKVAAATGARDARLPQIAQGNNSRLLSIVDEMGGARPNDSYGQGSAVAGAIRALDESMQANVGNLYRQARDSGGRSLPLDGAAWTRQANQMLDEAMVGGALPQDVATTMNRVATGEIPLTVEIAEQIKTRIGQLQRGASDGNARYALGLVRQALDDAPLRPAQQVNPGNMPAVPGTVPPSPMTVGRESIDAFNAARQAARGRFSWQESSPVIGRALEGANADTFVAQNVISKAAGFDDVARAAEVINATPAARESVRTAIVQHLKGAAVGRGGETATGNFSGNRFTAALKDIGDRKLGLFFDADEIETLKAMSRAGSAEVFQPRGSAVNNSNTAAGVAGLLQGISKYAKPIANKLPFGAEVIGAPLDNMTVWAMQRPATNIPQGLLSATQKRGSNIDPLLLPALYGGGLLAPRADR